MISNTSSTDKLIKNHNPFAGNMTVRTQQIWYKSFPDVPSINAHASNAVFEAIEKISKGKREIISITIASSKGAGKSHIISRVRHHLQEKEDSLFIYMSSYDNLNQIQYQFLQRITSSLRAFGSQKVMQWQEIAAALINEARKWNHPPQKYINSIKFSSKIVEQLTKEILLIKPNITDPYIVKAILWTLSTDHIVYANHWLSGAELAQEQAIAMGIPNLKKEDREANALNTVRQILDITSNYKIPVICFDELDNLEVSDSGFTTAQVVANLVKDMYNSLKKGVFLLTMYRETWEEQIKLLPQAEAVIDRLVSDSVNRLPIRLNFLNPDDVIAIVSQWLQEFYQEHQHTPPHPLYPFDENQLRELGKERPTVRAVLKWCADNFGAIPPPPNPVKRFFQSELANIETSINSLIEDELAITAALKVGFLGLAKYGVEVESVKVEGVEEIITTTADQGYLNFRIVGNNRKVKIGILILQKPHGAFIGAALKRLINYEKFDFSRGCLIRSKKINPGASVPQQCLKILKKQTGAWILLRGEDIKSLLAISSIYYNCRNYELTEEHIFEFIKEEKIAINNPLIREILRDPSGQEATDLTGYGFPVAIPKPIGNAE